MCDISFTDGEKDAIIRVSKIFLISKQKYCIFKYINNPNKTHQLKPILCEAIFRNTILELYSIFFDSTRKTIAHTIMNKLRRMVSQNNGKFILKWDGNCINIDNGKTEKLFFTKQLNVLIDVDQTTENGTENITSNDSASFETINLKIDNVIKTLKIYRHQVLAHKPFESFDYMVTQNHLDMLIIESDKIISVLLNIINPSASYALSVDHMANNHAIRQLFNNLARD